MKLSQNHNVDLKVKHIIYTIKNLTENKITKDKNGENIRHLEITEAV